MLAKTYGGRAMHKNLVARPYVDPVRHGVGMKAALRLLDIDVAGYLDRLSAEQTHDV
jgi:hypothetical protein